MVFLFLLVSCSIDDTPFSSTDENQSGSDIATEITMVTRSPNFGFWSISNRYIQKSPYYNRVAVSAHNCYDQEHNRTDVAKSKVKSAITSGADLIELDLISYNNEVYVCHNDINSSALPRLEQILQLPELQVADVSLFLELKETNPDKVFIRRLLQLLKNYNVVKAGRPVFIRSFDDNKKKYNLIYTQELLRTEFPELKEYVFLSKLFMKNTLNEQTNQKTHADILAAKNNGYHMVEFEFTTKSLYSNIMYAKALGLGVNIWTIPSKFGEVYIAQLREEVDVVTVDYSITKAKEVIKEANGLLYFNTATENPSTNTIKYKRRNMASYFLSVNGSGNPKKIYDGAGEDRFGVSLQFNKSAKEYVSTYDADNSPGKGYLVSAVVNFDELSSTSATRVILGKADNASFTLEMKSGKLRFGVKVNGSYRYAYCSLGEFNLTDSYILTGAYDGNGGVYLWVDNVKRGSGGSYVGGVEQNNSPIIIGADPQGSTNTRYHSSCKIQRVQVLDWGDH